MINKKELPEQRFDTPEEILYLDWYSTARVLREYTDDSPENLFFQSKTDQKAMELRERERDLRLKVIKSGYYALERPDKGVNKKFVEQ